MSTNRTFLSGTLVPESNVFIVCGGLSNATGGVLTAVKTCERLSLNVTSMWVSVGNMTLARFSHRSVLYRGAVVAVGGHDGKVILNVCEQYNITSNKWVVFPSLLTQRFHFGAAVLFDRIYVAGGYITDTVDGLNPDIEVFNGTAWSKVTSFSTPVSQAYCLALSFQNKFVLLGGADAVIEVFDPLTSTQSALPPMMPHFALRLSPAAVVLH